MRSATVYEDDKMLVFKYIERKAKVLLLTVPREHSNLLSELSESRAMVLAHMLRRIPDIAAQNGCKDGYRLVINQGDDAGQTVPHLHIHILGGESLPW